VVTDPQTQPQTHTQTEPNTIHCAAASVQCDDAALKLDRHISYYAVTSGVTKVQLQRLQYSAISFLLHISPNSVCHSFAGGRFVP